MSWGALVQLPMGGEGEKIDSRVLGRWTHRYGVCSDWGVEQRRNQGCSSGFQGV